MNSIPLPQLLANTSNFVIFGALILGALGALILVLVLIW